MRRWLGGQHAVRRIRRRAVRHDFEGELPEVQVGRRVGAGERRAGREIATLHPTTMLMSSAASGAVLSIKAATTLRAIHGRGFHRC